MDVIGQYILIQKHTLRKGKKARRHYGDGSDQDMAKMRELAGKYAADNNEDFLIVQIVEEISKPEKEKADV